MAVNVCKIIFLCLQSLFHMFPVVIKIAIHIQSHSHFRCLYFSIYGYDKERKAIKEDAI